MMISLGEDLVSLRGSEIEQPKSPRGLSVGSCSRGHFGSTDANTGRIRGRLAWAPPKDDRQVREACRRLSDGQREGGGRTG